jgi:hypothetical protein
MQLRGLEEKFKPVGNEISSLISEKIEMGSVYPDRTKTKVLREARRFYRRKMAELLTANEGKELSFDQKDELQDLTEEYAEGQLTKYDFKGDKKEGSEGEVSLDGTVKTSTDTPESDVILSQEDLDIYNQYVRGKPEEEAKWLAAGKSIPQANEELKNSTLDNITEQIGDITEELLEDYSDEDSPLGKIGKERFEEQKAELEAKVLSLEEQLTESQSMSESQFWANRLRVIENQTKPRGAMRIKMRNEEIAKIKQRLAEAEAQESE